MLQYWFHIELIRWRSHILILWLYDFKNKDYIQGTKVSTSDLLMNIWLLPCTLSEHSSLARSLIICGIKTSFSTCLSLEFSARVKGKNFENKNCYLYIRKSLSKEITQLCLYNIQQYTKTVTNSSRNYHERTTQIKRMQNPKFAQIQIWGLSWIFLLCLMCIMNQKQRSKFWQPIWISALLNKKSAYRQQSS